MNCYEATEILNKMIFEDDSIDVDLRQHLESCSSCSQVYRDVRKAREVMDLVRHSEPVLRNPGELTENIMASIGARQKETPVVPLLLQRLLAAASVAIFLLFGYEQYNVVKKVSALETQFTEIKQNSRYSDPRRLAATLDINKAGISLSEIERFLSSGKGLTPSSFSLIKKRLDQRNNK